ncbi:hypothetical protein B0T22DRAFT_538694 [Podospora appendiculata]|uniref:DUF7514 domain-containing protein n=1 Tax=Podospora appendiculata TaxID=314037 RepID=A0AAE1C930_9PEZI|nr:hypothetical protein B0T22DRAFT_538694 [Podospora appendiculata]
MEDHLAWRNAPDGAKSADKDWGVLFDDDGAPRERVEEVLMGLGDYILDISNEARVYGADHDHLQSRKVDLDGMGLVTPAKMSWLLTKTRVHAEDDSLIGVFSRKYGTHKERSDRLEDLFESLNCQFELGPEEAGSSDKVPCLLARGFATFMITLIRANPDREAKRFAKMARMPFKIPKAAGRGRGDTESPNVFSRHLFPSVRDVTTSAKLDIVLLRVTRAVSGDLDDLDDLDAPLRWSTSISPPVLQSARWSYRLPSPVSTYQPTSPLSSSPCFPPPLYSIPSSSATRPHYLRRDERMPDASRAANLSYLRGGYLSDEYDDDYDDRCGQEISVLDSGVHVTVHHERNCERWRHGRRRCRSSERL